MINRSQIQAYINNFRRRIAPFLRPGIGLHCNIYPALSGGLIEGTKEEITGIRTILKDIVAKSPQKTSLTWLFIVLLILGDISILWLLTKMQS